VEALDVVVNNAGIVLVSLCLWPVWLRNKLDPCFVKTTFTLLN